MSNRANEKRVPPACENCDDFVTTDLFGNPVEVWPEWLTRAQVRSLSEAGYTPTTVRQADPEDLVTLPKIGSKTARMLTGRRAKRRAPDEVRWFRSVIGFFPPRSLHDRVAAVVKARRDEDALRACYDNWISAGYNPHNLAWFFDYYAKGYVFMNSRRRRRIGNEPKQPPNNLPFDLSVDALEAMDLAEQEGISFDEAADRLRRQKIETMNKINGGSHAA